MSACLTIDRTAHLVDVRLNFKVLVSLAFHVLIHLYKHEMKHEILYVIVNKCYVIDREKTKIACASSCSLREKRNGKAAAEQEQ